MLARRPRLACLIAASLLASCSADPHPVGQGDGAAGRPDGGEESDGGRPNRAPDTEGGPRVGDGGRDAAEDTGAPDADADVDAGPPDATAPHALLRVVSESTKRIELHAVASDGTHWRVHQALAAATPFSTPRIDGYLPAPGARVLVETLESDQDGLYIAPVQTDAEVALEAATDDPADLHARAFIDASRVLVDSPGTTGRRLSIVDLGTQTQIPLTPNGITLGGHALAPDAEALGYLAAAPAEPTRLYTVSLNGVLTRHLSQSLGNAPVLDFVWSNTATWVAMRVDDGPGPSLWVVAGSGESPAVQLADSEEGAFVEAEGIAFVPDDSRVLYVEKRERRELHSSTPTGDESNVLTRSLTGNFDVSKTGDWVCYYERDKLGDVSAHISKSDGKGEHAVRLSGSLAQGDACTFDDDGQVVIGFARNDSSAPWAYRLSNGETHSLAIEGFASTHWIGLSPAGHHALVEGRDHVTSEGELFVFDLEKPSAPPRSLGRVPRRQHVEPDAVGLGLRWAASGSFVYFLDGGTGARVLTRIAVDDGSRERLEPQGAIVDFALLEGCCTP